MTRMRFLEGDVHTIGANCTSHPPVGKYAKPDYRHSALPEELYVNLTYTFRAEKSMYAPARTSVASRCRACLSCIDPMG
ncbi:unnamed protein product [Chondrus crispus]|uniref:Uncharacterized protein n=1 Tax=Chondrus crispus TaxID=2769 RepID=R7Q6S6_CHOCR|nr:unnamed protein product [Chondrus crispus]CDF33076.1 unnamed protein product [Chondrus crispus]|eukprot:XP_005712879.1 unnamed protein product [Chondrus crispus]